MELVKRQIHMNRMKGRASTQITMDDDLIVPDTMEDMAQVLLATGDILVEAVRPMEEKVQIKGKLDFQVLYRKEGGGLQTMAGQIPFEETVNVSGLEEKDDVSVSWSLEDLKADMIHSRKLGMMALVSLQVQAETLAQETAASDVDMEPGEETQVRIEELEIASIALKRRDTFRIQEEIALPANKPNVDRLLWREMSLRGVNTRPMDGALYISGDLMLFLLYAGEGEDTPVQWLEESIPFAGEVDLPEAVEGMVPSISVRLVHRELEAKPDYDGEMRDLELDAVLELDMKLYEEKKIELLGDFYSNDRELELESGEVCFDRLLSKNTGKCRIAEKLDLNSSDRILQICHNDGTIKIDDIEIKDESLHIDGVLEVSLLYLTSDDGEPVKAETEAVPFHYEAEAPGITSDSVYQLNTGLEQMTAVMAGGGTVEVKAVLNLDILVLQPVKEPVILGVKEMPLDLEKLQELPGITGYIVQPGDCLWDIAKRFHTTRKQVMESNGLSGDQIKPGDRLILVKEIAGA